MLLQVDGTAAKPITIQGSGGTANRGKIVVHGSGEQGRVFEVMHDFYILEVRGCAGRLDEQFLSGRGKSKTSVYCGLE